MKYRSAADFRRALEQRLVDRSRATGESLVRLRKTVVFDRLLARLLNAAPGRWVLTGALALDFRLGAKGRTTKDLDLVRRDDGEAATADLLAAQKVDLGDFFVFSVVRTTSSRAPPQDVIRYRVRADLGGRLFEEVLLDIGFSDPLRWAPDLLRAPDLLSFAGIQPAEVPALPLEQHVAEKVHAYTRTYAGGMPSTRVKDLLDLVVVKRSMTLDAARLRQALQVTFETRGSQAIPSSLPAPPRDWNVSYRRHAEELGLNPDIRLGHREAAELLDPILAGGETGHWDPDRSRWSDPLPEGSGPKP